MASSSRSHHRPYYSHSRYESRREDRHDHQDGHRTGHVHSGRQVQYEHNSKPYLRTRTRSRSPIRNRHPHSQPESSRPRQISLSQRFQSQHDQTARGREPREAGELPRSPSRPPGHKEDLNYLFGLASEHPRSAKEQMDRMIQERGSETFTEEEIVRIRDLENLCFEKQNKEQSISETLRFIRDSSHEEARVQARLLVDWQLHFREDTQRLRNQTYQDWLKAKHYNFDNFLKYLHSLMKKDKNFSSGSRT